MDNKIKLLIISTYYPPTISIASNRILAISKYLSPKIFDITVLTYGKETNVKAPPNVKVIRISENNFFRPFTFNKAQNFFIHKSKALYNRLLMMFVKDEWRAWRKISLNYLLKNYDLNSFDFVISSFAPIAPHKLAIQMKQKGFQFNWIADMRDEMSMNYSHSSHQREFFKKVEALIFSKAKAITSTAFIANKNFKKLSASHHIDCFEVKNGFDFELIPESKKNKTFTISHIGTFYGKRKPDLFIKAISDLIEEGKIKDIRLQFIGVSTLVNNPTSLKGKITTTPKIEHAKAIDMMRHSDVNLLIMSPAQMGAIPGKVYEYMGSLKPIIGIFDSKGNEQMREILLSSGLASISEFDDLENLKKNILNIYENWYSNIIPKYNKKYIQQFHRKEQVKIMEEYILKNAHG